MVVYNETKDFKKFVDGTTDFKWDDGNMQSSIRSVLDKIREEKSKTEQQIYESIKKFEWNTGIKIIKLDIENPTTSKVKIVLERLQ